MLYISVSIDEEVIIDFLEYLEFFIAKFNLFNLGLLSKLFVQAKFSCLFFLTIGIFLILLLL